MTFWNRLRRRGRKSRFGPDYQSGVEAALRMDKGQVGIIEARFLVQLVQSLRTSGPLIEIGTLFGHSTTLLLIGKREEQVLYTVDNYSWNPFKLDPALHRTLTRHRLREGLSDLNLIMVDEEKRAFQAAYSGGRPSLVFIDADHSYEATLSDIRWAMSVDAEVICGHDFGPDFPGVVRAVTEAGGPGTVVGSLWTLKRSDAAAKAS